MNDLLKIYTKNVISKTIEIENKRLNTLINQKANSKGLVIFVHGSGSSRLSPRNQFVASYLNQYNLDTFLFDLLTPEEEEIDMLSGEYRFNIQLLAERLIQVTKWVKEQPEFQKLPIGYFGSSTGAAAALIAASYYGKGVNAVVSRGGRPDLAENDILKKVQAPTLLIVGGLDDAVIELNKLAQEQMTNFNKLQIIPGATHLFEESNTLEQVAKCASEWFLKYLK